MNRNKYRWVFTMCMTVAITLSAIGELKAQYSAQQLAKSLVRVKVTGGTHKGKPRGDGYASGFVWQNPLQVVTSLHAMRLGDGISISVEWTSSPNPEKKEWVAKVDKVLEYADLVLLKVEPGFIGTPGWTPLTKKALRQVGSELMAVGYFKSSPGWRRMSLKITETQNNNLQDFPKKIVESLQGFGIPKIDLDIIHFENNSLLPGYSGSPLVDSRGHLVGIGDGGLENGDKNISWGIPAKYLDELMKSNVQHLPENLANAPLHYSAEEPPGQENIINQQLVSKTVSAEQYEQERLDAIEFGGYEFFYTKTRTLGELVETSDNPQSLYSIMVNFANYYFGITDQEGIDELLLQLESDFVYDIYQDINYGVIIAIPTGTQLRIDTETNFLWVDFGDPQTNVTWRIMYRYDQDVTEEDRRILTHPEEMVHVLGEQMTQEMSDVQARAVPRVESTEILRTADGGLMNVYYDILDAQNNTIAFNFNKIVINRDVYLVASGVYGDFNSSIINLINTCKQNGIDCSNVDANSICQTMCQGAYQWLYLMTAQHLTKFVDFDTEDATIVPVNQQGAAQPPAVQFGNIYYEHNIPDATNSQYGLLIHAQFAVQGLQGRPSQAVAFFYDYNGQPLMDINQQYNSVDGQVSTYFNFTPEYPNTQYDDFRLYIPYSELHLPQGQWQIRYVLNIFDLQTGQPVGQSPEGNFSVTQY